MWPVKLLLLWQWNCRWSSDMRLQLQSQYMQHIHVKLLLF
jgi:hypothetical protein